MSFDKLSQSLVVSTFTYLTPIEVAKAACSCRFFFKTSEQRPLLALLELFVKKLNIEGNVPRPIAARLQCSDLFEKRINRIYLNIGRKEVPSAVCEMAEEQRILCPVYEEMLKEFGDEFYKTKYGYEKQTDESLFNLTIGSKVQYFFGLISPSIYSMKYKTMVGLMNLLRYGPQILDELKAKLFMPSKKHYSTMQGLDKMADCFGFFIELNQRISNVQSAADAKEQAQQIIDLFKQEFIDFSNEFPKRNLEIPSGSIPFALNGYDYGNYPVYATGTMRGTHYTVNVPDTADVVDTLLRAPLLLPKIYLIIKAKYEGSERQRRLRELFDKGISVGCVQSKITAILDLYKTYHSEIYPVQKQKTWLTAQEFINLNSSERRCKVLPLGDSGKVENEFIEDPRIIPPVDARMDVDTWKKQALPNYLQSARNKGWLNGSHYLEKVEWDNARKYRLFDASAIEYVMTRFVINATHSLGNDENRFALS